jgi:hypothetical protein
VLGTGEDATENDAASDDGAAVEGADGDEHAAATPTATSRAAARAVEEITRRSSPCEYPSRPAGPRAPGEWAGDLP